MTARSIPATNSDDAAIEELDRLARNGADDADKKMMRLAETTTSPRVRNAAAIAMADLAIDGAGQLLVRLVGRDDTRGHRGTLLYALEELGEEVPLPVLVSVLLDGNYESREQALDLLGKDQIAYTTEQLDAAIAELSGLASSDDQHASDVGRTAVRWLKSMKRKRK